MLVCITASGKFSKNAVQDLITDFFMPYVDKELNPSESELQFIAACQSADENDLVPVYDLARGLYPSMRMPLDGAQSHAEALSGEGWCDPLGDQSESLRIDLRAGDEMTLEGPRELEKDVHHAIRIREQQMHQTYVNGIKEEVEEVLISGEAVNETEKIKYYKSPRGNLRPANKSKARPKETEVWLTPEEIEQL